MPRKAVPLLSLLLALSMLPLAAAQGGDPPSAGEVREGSWLRATLTPATLVGEPQEPLFASLRIENLRDEPIQVSVRRGVVPDRWVALEPHPINLTSRDESGSHVTVPLALFFHPGGSGKFDEKVEERVTILVARPDAPDKVLESLEMPLRAHVGGTYVPGPAGLILIAAPLAALATGRLRS